GLIGGGVSHPPPPPAVALAVSHPPAPPPRGVGAGQKGAPAGRGAPGGGGGRPAPPALSGGHPLVALPARRPPVVPPRGNDGLASYVLPGFTLGWFVVAGMMRLLRSSMLEVLDSDYVKLARVKGVAERRVVWQHALRNALIPVVTFAGIYFAVLVT